MSLIPRPTAEQLAEAYDASYYGSRATKFDGLAARFIQQCRRAKAVRLAKQLPSGAVVLDVGCGDGSFLSALGDLGDYTLHGVELNGPASRRAQRDPRIQLQLGDLLQTGYSRDQFDLVTLFHVFEHLVEPRKTLALLHDILKPGGRLVLSFPNCGSVQARLFKGHWLHLDPPRHLFLLSPPVAEREFARAGFSVVGRRFFSPEQNPYGFMQSLMNWLLTDRDVLYERLKGNERYAPRYGRWSLCSQKALAGLLWMPAMVVDAVESAFNRGATVEYTLRKESR